MIVVSASTITETWIEGTERLLAAGGDVFTSILRVTAPLEPAGAEYQARLLLDELLGRRYTYDTQTVANTIFPAEVANNRTAAQLYERYSTRTYPLIRRLAPNRRGTYFLRLMHLPVREADGRVVVHNPLARCIAKMRQQLARRGPLRAAYELSVYRPEADANVGMGFPCLSHVSFKLDPQAGQLHLTALYRNQFYLQRAYGNLLGLARLQAFVAREVGLAPGELVCHATHAHVEAGRGVVAPLLHAMRDMLDTGASTAGPRQASEGVPDPVAEAVHVGR